MKISRLRPHASGPNIILAALLILIEAVSSTNPPATLLDEDDTSLHFSNDQNGNAVWVVDDIALPWVGSYEYLSSAKGDKTVLMIVADSSTGKTLAECSLQGHDDDYDHWKRFQWALGPESLQCTVSQTNSSAAIFPKSSVPRSYSIRIQAASGPACMRDLLIQNERPHGCPPRLTRNKFTSNNLLCGCPDGRDHSTEESTDEEPTEVHSAAHPPFPRFEFGPTSGGVLSSSTGEGNGRSSTGSTGKMPSFTISPCANHNCKNGGTCVVTVNGTAACLCDLNFTGSECQFRSTPITADPCANVPCQNGGKCRATGNDGIAVCDCTSGWTGLLCETKITKPVCTPECANGECVRDENGRPVCECTQGFTGINCNIVDVCLGDAACSLYGPLAKCVLDDETYTLSSLTLKNASYECRCPHPVDGQYVDCLQLHLSSTTMGTTDEGEEGGVFETGSTTLTQGLPTITPAFPLTGIPARPKINSSQPPMIPADPNRIPAGPFSGHPTPIPDIHGQNQQMQGQNGQNQGQATVTQTPFIFQPSGTFNPNGEHTMFPIVPNPQVTGSTTGTTFIFPPTAPTPSPTASIEHQPTHAVGPIGLGEDEDEDHDMHSHETEDGHTSLPSSTVFPTPSSVDMTDAQSTIAGSHETLHQLITSGRPIGVPDMSPEPENISETSPKTTQTTTTSPSSKQTITPKIPVVVPIPTTQSTLPFWMLQTSTDGTTKGEETTDHEDSEENAEEETEGHTTTTRKQSSSTSTSQKTTMKSSEATTTTAQTMTQMTTNATTTESADVTKNGSQRTQRSSTASWIVAIIALIALFLLLLATALFVLRYIKQSRKLHGKYNPAREEHNMSAAYAMPMSHIAKEERLI